MLVLMKTIYDPIHGFIYLDELENAWIKIRRFFAFHLDKELTAGCHLILKNSNFDPFKTAFYVKMNLDQFMPFEHISHFKIPDVKESFILFEKSKSDVILNSLQGV